MNTYWIKTIESSKQTKNIHELNQKKRRKPSRRKRKQKRSITALTMDFPFHYK